jgi:uncharacterized glyoxalase superfamily protein PhnB
MITPCIHFQGNCDEAINFYKEALGAEDKAIFYAKDAPDFNAERRRHLYETLSAQWSGKSVFVFCFSVMSKFVTNTTFREYTETI